MFCKYCVFFRKSNNPHDHRDFGSLIFAFFCWFSTNLSHICTFLLFLDTKNGFESFVTRLPGPQKWYIGTGKSWPTKLVLVGLFKKSLEKIGKYCFFSASVRGDTGNFLQNPDLLSLCWLTYFKYHRKY